MHFLGIQMGWENYNEKKAGINTKFRLLICQWPLGWNKTDVRGKGHTGASWGSSNVSSLEMGGKDMGFYFTTVH